MNNSNHPIMDGFLLPFPAIKIKKTALENVRYIVYNILVKKRGTGYMKIMILKDMDDDSVLRILSCADDVDTDALAKDILEKEYEIDGEIRDIDEVCAELQSKYSFESVEHYGVYGV